VINEVRTLLLNSWAVPHSLKGSWKGREGKGEKRWKKKKKKEKKRTHIVNAKQEQLIL